MREGWNKERIGDIATVGDGAHASIKREQKGVLYLTSKNFNSEGIKLDKVDYISQENYIKHFNSKSKALTKPLENDILLSIIGTMGAPYLIKAKDTFGLSSSVSILRPNQEKILPQYLVYWIKGEYFQGSINNIKSGVAQSFLSLEMIRSLPCHYPPLPTQQRIASILSAYDDLIENNLKRIKLLEEMAQSYFDEWYSINTDYKETNLGALIGHEIGGGWGEEEQIGEFNKTSFVIRGTDINELPNGKIEKVPLRYHKKSNLASRKLQDGDIIFEVSGGSSYEGVAKTLLVTEELLNQFNSPVMPASFCKLVRPVERKHSSFIFLFLRFLRKLKGTEVFEIRSASNIVNYNWTAFLKFQKVKKPKDEQLYELNKMVQPIYKQIYNLGNQNQLLQEARDILLPRLMTGMVDIDDMLGQNEDEVGVNISMAAEQEVKYKDE